MSGMLGWIRKSLSGHFTHGADGRRAEDPLELVRIVEISLGTLRFFRPVFRAVRFALPTFVALAPAAIYFAWTVTSVFSNGLLNARPLEPNQATVLFLEPELFVRSALERARGLDPDALREVAQAAGYRLQELRLSGDDVQQRKDALRASLTPQLARLPRALPAEISWERGRVQRWELLPELAPAARSTLAWHWISALILVHGCGAAAYFALYRRTGRLPSATIVLLAIVPLAPFFIDATWNGVLHAQPIQSATAKFLRVDPDETTLAPLRARRGLDADLLGEAAGTLGIAERLESHLWDGGAADVADGAEQRAALLDAIGRAHPDALPVALLRRSEVAWRPRIAALLSADARRQLRGHLVAWVLGVALIFAPLGMALALYALRLLQQVNQSLRVDLMARIQSLSLRHHQESQVGDAIYRLFQDSSVVLSLLRSVLITPLYNLAYVPVALVFLSMFSPWLSLGLVIVMLPMLWVGGRSSPDLRRAFRGAREKNSALTSRIQETLTAIKVIKAYGAERVEQARFERASEDAFAATYAARTRIAGLGVVLFLFGGGALIASDSALALDAAAEHPTFLGAVIGFVGFAFWNLGAFSAARARMSAGTGGVERLLITWARAQDQAVGMDRVLELLTARPEVQDAPDAVPLRAVTRGVVYRGVGFAYKGERRVLSCVDLAAESGSITAIVGPTGSGKSTLMALLVRLYDPQAGSIAIDGLDLRRYQLESLRRRVGIALQQNLLFGTTIRENIRYAMPDASDAEVRAAARTACADEFIEALPQGYDTLLGERGTRLSSGQRQRLSIARAVIKDPAILVLDEPTAALDAETELRVLERLAAWGEGRVIFLITHRLSTIRRADQIVYLRDGCVAEAGSPEALMQRPSGLYRRFVEIEDVAPREAPLSVAVSA